MVILFFATFSKISVISWSSVLLVEETEYPQKITGLSQVTDNFDQLMLYIVHFTWMGFELTTSVVNMHGLIA